MITKEQAIALRHGDVIYDSRYKLSNNRPAKWRVNGAMKLWKQSPKRFELPIKQGIYNYGYLTNHTAVGFCLTEEEAIRGRPA